MKISFRLLFSLKLSKDGIISTMTVKLFFWLVPIVSRYKLERWIISLNWNKVIVYIYDEYCIFPWKYRNAEIRFSEIEFCLAAERTLSWNYEVAFVIRFYIFPFLRSFRSHNECNSTGHTRSNKYSSIVHQFLFLFFCWKFYILDRGLARFIIYRMIILSGYANGGDGSFSFNAWNWLNPKLFSNGVILNSIIYRRSEHAWRIFLSFISKSNSFVLFYCLACLLKCRKTPVWDDSETATMKIRLSVLPEEWP